MICADLGTKILYIRYGRCDTLSNEVQTHWRFWPNVSTAVGDFVDHLKEDAQYGETLGFIFSKFCRRIKVTGAGVTTDPEKHLS